MGSKRHFDKGATRGKGGSICQRVLPWIPVRWTPEPKPEPKVVKPRKGTHRKLSDDQVRALRAANKVWQGSINSFCIVWADQLGCSPTVIRGIIDGLNYKEVV